MLTHQRSGVSGIHAGEALRPRVQLCDILGFCGIFTIVTERFCSCFLWELLNKSCFMVYLVPGVLQPSCSLVLTYLNAGRNNSKLTFFCFWC